MTTINDFAAAGTAVYELLGVDREIPPIIQRDKALRVQFEALIQGAQAQSDRYAFEPGATTVGVSGVPAGALGHCLGANKEGSLCNASLLLGNAGG